MAKESLYGIEKSLVFRETFNSFPDIARNGGTITGSPTINGGVMTFNGSTDYISLGVDRFVSALEGRPGATRIKLPSASGRSNRLFSFGGEVYLSLDSATSVTYDVNGSGSLTKTISNIDNIEAEFILTWDGTNSYLYLNGSLVSSDANSYPSFNTNRDHKIGSSYTGASNWYNSTIDLFEVYNKTLSANEVSLLYNNELHSGLVNDNLVLYHDYVKNKSSFDESLTGNNGTDTAITYGNNIGARFNGSTSGIDAGNDSSIDISSQEIAVEVVLKMNADSLEDIVSKFDGSNVQYLLLNDGAGDYTFFSGGGAGANEAVVSNSGTIGKFTHLVAVYDGADTMIYVNGVKGTDASTPLAPVTASTNLFIGQRTGGIRRLNGNIKVVRIYSQALTQKQIIKNYQYFKDNNYL